MTTKRKRSTFYFIGQLSPEDLCIKFHPGEIKLGNGLILDIYQHGLAIWIPGTTQEFSKLKSQALEAVEIVLNTFMLITGGKLNFRLINWVEAKGVVSKKNTIGFIISHPKIIHRKERSRHSSAWRRIGKHYLRIKRSFYHRIALRDYNNCMNSSTEDAYFYAFRIIEDIRAATTQHLPKGLKKKDYWDEMHKALGTNESMLKPLTDVSESVRHGDLKNKSVQKANKDVLRQIAVDVMKKEFKRTFKGLI